MTEENKIDIIEKAGVVAFTPEGDVVLTTTQADYTKWVLPKGHLEDKDAVEGKLDMAALMQCALREAREELGWSVVLLEENPLKEIIRATAQDDNGEVTEVERITLFVARISTRITRSERPILFCSPDVAITTLTYRDYREAVVEAIQRLAVIEYLNKLEAK